MNQSMYQRLVDQGIIGYDLRQTVYKYRSVRSAIKIIKSNTVYFSPVNKLDDLLELNPDQIDLNFTQESKDIYWQRLGVTDVTDEEHKKMMYDSINNWLRKGAIGIFSAGRTPVNLHLWQHYGARHTGVCFGFRCPDENTISWQLPNSKGVFLGFNVKYTDEPKFIRFIDEGELNDDLFCWFNTKVCKYKPEDEIRIINDNGSGPELFNKDLLYEVVFGMFTSQDTINFILKLLIEYNYPVQRVGKARIQNGNMVVDYIALL